MTEPTHVQKKERPLDDYLALLHTANVAGRSDRKELPCLRPARPRDSAGSAR